MFSSAAMMLMAGGALAGAVDARVYGAGQIAAGPARVVDGDTLDLRVAGGTLRVRMHGIDAPELGQSCADAAGALRACGADAAQALNRLIAGAAVRCTAQGDVSYGRLVAVCAADGVDLGAAMVGQGHAWASRRFSAAYVPHEGAARAAGLGVWQGPATPPWSWRKGVRMAAAAQTCAIKGNVSKNGMIYHLPGTREYARTRISPSKGERWFCSEADARAAGWRPARG